MEEEYVYLYSNFNALKYYGKPNDIGNFKNQLACQLPITQKWKVALAEIVYTKSWYNVLTTHKINLIDELGTVLRLENSESIIKPGFYETPEILCNEINKLLEKFSIKKTPKLNYNHRENYVYMHAGDTDNLSCFPDLGEEVENILGLRNRNTFALQYHTTAVGRSDQKETIHYIFKGLDVFNEPVMRAYHPVEINAGIHYLSVYCDIVTESFAGDTKSQLLRLVEVPRKVKFGETVHLRYSDRNFKSIYSDKFQNIEISIKDSSGRVIPFKSGQCTVVLHFKNSI